MGMTRKQRQPRRRYWRAVALLACLAALPAAAQAEDAPIMDQVPLVRGFYLHTVMTCDEASNATLGLLHKDGFNAGRQAFCSFTTLTKTGADSYDYVESCQLLLEDPDGPPVQSDGKLTLLNDRGFRLTTAGGEVDYFYCQQDNLPEPWATNDISDLLK